MVGRTFNTNSNTIYCVAFMGVIGNFDWFDDLALLVRRVKMSTQTIQNNDKYSN